MARFLAAMLLVLLTAPLCRANSVGAGIVGSLSTGSADEELKYSSGLTKAKHHYDLDRRSIGMAIGSLGATESFFTVKTDLLYTKMEATTATNRYSLEGVTTQTDFCFGLIRNSRFRFWVGPELVIEYLSGNRLRDGIKDHSYHADFGVGAAVGVNLSSEVGSLFAKVNYNLTGALMFNNTEWTENYLGLSVGYMFPVE